MRRMKLIALGMTAIMGIGFLPMKAEAAQNEYTTVYGISSNFSDDWENTIFYYNNSSKDKKIAKMVYGYETDWWNEDYTWTYGYTCQTQASMTNSKGTYSGSKKISGRTSKIEVHHKANNVSVKYGIWFDDYSCYNYKEYDTNVK